MRRQDDAAFTDNCRHSLCLEPEHHSHVSFLSWELRVEGPPGSGDGWKWSRTWQTTGGSSPLQLWSLPSLLISHVLVTATCSQFSQTTLKMKTRRERETQTWASVFADFHAVVTTVPASSSTVTSRDTQVGNAV